MKSIAARLPSALALGLAALLAALIFRAAYPTPFADELLFGRLWASLAEGRLPDLRELLAAHYGHPYLLLKLAISATLLLGLPWLWLMYGQVALLVTAAWIACLRRSKGPSGVVVVACCLAVLSPRQWENLYWGMGIAFALFLLSSLTAFWAVERWSKSGQARSAYLALAAAGFASVSNGAGIVTLLLTCIAVPLLRHRVATTTTALASLILGGALFLLAQRLAPSVGMGAAALDLGMAAEHALRMFGHQFVDGQPRSTLTVILGILAAALVPYLLIAAGPRWREFSFEFLCILLSVLLIIGVTYSRTTAGIYQPDAPRYVPLVAPLTIGTVSALSRLNRRWFVLGITALLALGCAKAAYVEWFSAPYRMKNGAAAHHELCLRGSVHPIHNMNLGLGEQQLANLRTLFCRDLQRNELRHDPVSMSGRSGGPLTAPATASGRVVVTRWGPTETRRGQGVNLQPDGASAIWIEVTGVSAVPGAKVRFGGEHFSTATVMPGVVTAAVPRAVIDNAGDYLVAIEEASGRRTPVGTFRVRP